MRDAAQWGVECLLRQFPKACITVEPIDTLAHSEVWRIRVATEIERSYVVKSGSHPLMYREFVFYTELSPLLPDEICPRCFFSVDLDGVHAVLLEDVEGSPIEDNTYPPEARVERFVLALAKLHRHAQTIKDLHNRWANAFANHAYNTVSGRMQVLQARIDSFLAERAERLDSDILRELKGLARLAGVIESFGEETIIHGDAHFGNVIFGNGCARLIDWGNTALGIGEIDVAHAIALNLPRNYGGRVEERMIRLYSDRLGQDIEKSWKRYRAGVLYAIASSLGMREFGVPHWEKLFENAMQAGLDLDAFRLISGIST